MVRARIMLSGGKDEVSVAWHILSRPQLVESHLRQSLLFIEPCGHGLLVLRDASNDNRYSISDLCETLVPGTIYDLHLEGGDYELLKESRWGHFFQAGDNRISTDTVQVQSRFNVTKAIITELTCLDTATTYLAAERFILNIPRHIFQQMQVAMHATNTLQSDLDNDADKRIDDGVEEKLRFTAPLFYAAILTAYTLTVAAFCLHSEVLAVRIFAHRQPSKDTYCTHMWAFSILTTLVLVALTAAFFLGLQIQELV